MFVFWSILKRRNGQIGSGIVLFLDLFPACSLKSKPDKSINHICCHRINDELSDTEADMRELQSATERAV